MRLSLAVLLASFCFLAAAGQGQNTIPTLIPDPHGNGSAWVAAEIAVQNGQLKPEFLGRHADELRELARQNGEALTRNQLPSGDRPCTLFKGESPAEHFHPTNTLEDLTRYGKTVVSGRIVAVREGFWYGLPASLLQLDAEWLKGDRPTGTTYFLYPFAHIDTAEGPICSKPVGNSGGPQVGDRLVIFSYDAPFVFDENRVVGADTARGLVHERSGKPARVPDSLVKLVGQGASPVDAIRAAARSSIESSRDR